MGANSCDRKDLDLLFPCLFHYTVSAADVRFVKYDNQLDRNSKKVVEMYL